MRRAHAAVVLLAAALLGVTAVDLAGRGLVSRALVDLAGRAPRAAEPPAPSSPAPPAPRVTTLEAPRFSAVAAVLGPCAPECTVTVTVQPSAGRRLSVDAPQTFFLRPSEGVRAGSDEGARRRARSPTEARALVEVPVVVDGRARVLGGELRVVTCDDATCSIDRAPIAVPLG